MVYLYAGMCMVTGLGCHISALLLIIGTSDQASARQKASARGDTRLADWSEEAALIGMSMVVLCTALGCGLMFAAGWLLA